ncbi:extracellular solute-binding protein [Paenibacillus sp. N4]|uniref:ABC transporter substrate-binding protein n=1 Tax=Paenibacillus vietnamensis TaxID=2590547 RepID=UPI001CD053AA|nr:extracellular solute-binding protein [Paenibacillus vietnamensis]MCA0755836.1 extracellular solute-binding protein [Paenibacillus vietnamensis]
MKSWRRQAFLSVIIVLILALVGCATGSNESGNEGNRNESADQNGAVTLRIVWWGSQARHDATQKAIELYSQKNPNVKFEAEFSGWDGYWDKLGVQFSAGNAPDIIQMDAAYLEDYATRGLFSELSSINTEQVSSELLASGKVNDTLYAMPLGSNAFGLIYDKSVVEKLGITPPSNGWTWDDYFAFVEEAKAKLGDGKSVIGDADGIHKYNVYQLAYGKGDVYANGTFNLDKDLYIEFLTKMKELRDKGAVPSAEITSAHVEFDPTADILVNETILMRPNYAAQIGSLDSLKPGAYGVVTMPRASESGGHLKPSMFWSINKSSKQQEEAQKFVDWFVNDPEAAKILGTSRGLPVNNSNLELLKSDFSTADKLSAELISVTADNNPQPFTPEPKGWSNFQNDYLKIYEKFMFDVITPEETYEEVMKLAQQYEEAN